MSESPNLKLPYILAAQAQKHVTHNEAVRALDAIVQLSVIDRDLAAPPASPVDGDRYLVAASPSGAWAGQANRIAAWQDGAWMFHVPRPGWIVWIADEAVAVAWSGTAWVSVTGLASVNPTPLVGVNATADTTNRLAVSAPATLLNHAGAGHQAKINKAAAADTASVLFQTAFSGRAEFGTTGDDNWHVKVSADGSTWKEALVADRTTGKVDFPYSGFLTNFAVNLLEDSGRFAPSTDWKSIFAAGAFQTPAYFTLYNSSTWTNHAKFIFNNNDYGGSAGALNADVKDLIDKIRDSGFRRFGVEFYVAKLTKGSGTDSSISVSGTSYYETLFSRQMPRLMAATLHLYARAKTGNAYFRSTGQTIYKDGVKEAAGLLLAPGDGWKSVRITDILSPRTAFGYTPATLDIYQANTGDELLIACPALFGGITDVNIDIGPVPAYNLWSLA